MWVCPACSAPVPLDGLEFCPMCKEARQVPKIAPDGTVTQYGFPPVRPVNTEPAVNTEPEPAVNTEPVNTEEKPAAKSPAKRPARARK